MSAALILGGVDLHGPHLFTVRTLPQLRGQQRTARHVRLPLLMRCVAPLAPARAAPQIFPHGSTDALPYATMGSGSLNAMAVFEAAYKDDMSREEAMALAARAIRRCGGGRARSRPRVAAAWQRCAHGWAGVRQH